MAVAPPPAYSPAPPPPTRRRRGCGCLGCVGVLLLVLVLAGAGIWLFAVRSASAGVASPAVLTVYLDGVQVGQGSTFSPGRTGTTLHAGGSVRTDQTGRAGIAFPDGSITRLAGQTEVQVTEAALDAHGALRQATLDQVAGRTWSSVQALSGGGDFRVRGHGVSAIVRGTEFEVYVAPDGSVLIKLYQGRLHIDGHTSFDLAAGQQVRFAPDGTAGKPGPIADDPADPFLTWVGPKGSETAAAPGNLRGTIQTSPAGSPLAQGASASSSDYYSPGGDLTTTLSYPGSLMKLSVIGPDGSEVARSTGPPPIRLTVPAAPAGRYHAVVTGVDLPTPELWSVTFATDPACTPGTHVDPASGIIRLELTDLDIANVIEQAQLAGSDVHITPNAGGATISGTVAAGAFRVSGTIVIYAASPGLGITIVSATFNGFNVTSAAAAQVARVTGRAMDGIQPPYTVDRVYSCRGPQGGMLVVEGHGATSVPAAG